jgi:peptide/nickel transport system permease protein
MKAYVIRRFIQSIIILFLIITIIFFLFRIIPSNPAAMLIDSQLSPEDRILVLAQWGLDKPLYIQYLNYIKNLLAGSFGVSFFYRKPVFDVLMETMLNTLTLMGPAMFIALGLEARQACGKGSGYDCNFLSSVAFILDRDRCFDDL